MTRIILPFTALVTVLFASSCEDEPQAVVQQGSAQFEKSELSFSENTETTTITVTLNKQATENGELSIQVTSSNVENFQFNPGAVDGIIKLPFFKGQSRVSFEVTSLDNDILDGDKALDFTIMSITPGYYIGATRTLSMKWADDETPAQVFFADPESHGRENSNNAFPVTVSFSHVTKAEGIVSVSIESADAVYGIHFTTTPAAINGLISLSVERGKNEVVFNVLPVDDELYNEQRTITYTIVGVEGGIEKGEILKHDLKITDDELGGYGKGYEVVGGGWRYKKHYEYNEDGTISKVYWDQYTPGHTGGIYSYVYNATGKLEKIIRSSVREEIFLREGDTIVKAEEYTNNILTKYTLYGYDGAGNVAEAAVHHRQPDGTFVLSMLFVYLYHTDHNVYKALTYAIPAGSDDQVLVSTKTFDNYLEVENPFPMVEVLPDQKAQNKLPSSYRVEENGHDITYQLTYQLSSEGKPLSRTATSPSGSETAQYEYY